MTTFVTIIYIIVALFMVLAILLQAGKGGGLGAALGGGASQTVFGGGGGADFMAKLTQGFAAAFMICAMYLAYASAHSGSDFLKRKSDELEEATRLATPDGEVNYERVGPNPLRLPSPEDAAQMRAGAGEASGSFAPDEHEDAEEEPPPTPAEDEAPTDDEAEGETPDDDGEKPDDDAEREKADDAKDEAPDDGAPAADESGDALPVQPEKGAD